MTPRRRRRLPSFSVILVGAGAFGIFVGCSESTHKDINYGTDAGAGYEVHPPEVHPEVAPDLGAAGTTGAAGAAGSVGAAGASGATGSAGSSGAAGAAGTSGAAGAAGASDGGADADAA